LTWSRSIRHVARRLLRAPLFTSVAILTLALGIGANAAIFSLVNGVLLQPLPFEDPERLVGVWHTAPGLGFDEVNQSPALHFTYREESRVFAEVGLWDNSAGALTGLDKPERIETLEVTEGTLPMLGVRPIMGRSFTAEDDSPAGAKTVLLTHGFWQTRFGGSPDVLGETITIDGEPREVIGVLPEDFRFLNAKPLAVLPFRFDRSEIDGVGNFSYQGIARLAPGATIEQANTDVDRMIRLALERYPNSLSAGMLEQARFAATIRPLMRDAIGNVGDVLWVLLGTVGLVLLIACANVANLFLVRADARHRELAIRSALGAGRLRLAREFLEESALLGLAGGVLGLLLAHGGLRLLVSMGTRSVPRLEEVGLDVNVLAYTLLLSVLASIVLGLLPAFRHLREEQTDGLKEGGRGSSDGPARRRVRATLVVGQVALALLLLTSSGLLLRSFQELLRVDPGFTDPEQLITFRVGIPEALVPEDADVPPMFESMVRGIEARPGIESVAISSSMTMDGHDSNDAVYVEGFPTPEDQLPPIRRFKWISPGYFATMGNPVLAGRELTWEDIQGPRAVAVISKTLADAYWARPSDAVGKRIRANPKSIWREVVGVVGPVHDDGVAEDPVAVVYWPLALDDFRDKPYVAYRWAGFVVRSDRVGTQGLMDEMRGAVWAVHPDLPVANVRTQQEILDRSLSRTSFAMTMLAIAALMALVLGAVGVYGVISYTVAQRTREIGVRVALGAQRMDVARLVLKQGLVLTGLGVGVGLVASLGLGRALSALLYGVEPTDPFTIGAVCMALMVVGFAATSLPARRAASVDPIEALRSE